MKKKQSTTPEKKITGQNETGKESVSEYIKLAIEESDNMLSKLKEHLREFENNPNNLLIIASNHDHFHISIVGDSYSLIHALAITMYKNKDFHKMVATALAALHNAQELMQIKKQNEKDTNKLPEA